MFVAQMFTSFLLFLSFQWIKRSLSEAQLSYLLGWVASISAQLLPRDSLPLFGVSRFHVIASLRE